MQVKSNEKCLEVSKSIKDFVDDQAFFTFQYFLACTRRSAGMQAKKRLKASKSVEKRPKVGNFFVYLLMLRTEPNFSTTTRVSVIQKRTYAHFFAFRTFISYCSRYGIQSWSSHGYFNDNLIIFSQKSPSSSASSHSSSHSSLSSASESSAAMTPLYPTSFILSPFAARQGSQFCSESGSAA
jgi:hypothetical protein